MVMPTIGTDGIATHYEISGSGAPILLMAPGGFDSAIENWSTTWPWQHFLPLQTFARHSTCIAYDRWHQRDARWSTIEGHWELALREHSAGRE
jgi:hypothetical protein